MTAILSSGHGDIVSLILKRPDVQVNLRGKDGVTALGLACLR